MCSDVHMITLIYIPLQMSCIAAFFSKPVIPKPSAAGKNYCKITTKLF
jgi:hypothetical protein